MFGFSFRREEKEWRKKLCNEKGGVLEEGGSFSFWVDRPLGRKTQRYCVSPYSNRLIILNKMVSLSQ